MNNFDKQDRIDELTAQYTQRQLAGLLIDTNRRIERIKKQTVKNAFIEAKIPESAKYKMIGEFSVSAQELCPVCDEGHANEDCEICGGEYDLITEIDIPWTTQKDIFKKFCECAAEEIK